MLWERLPPVLCPVPRGECTWQEQCVGFLSEAWLFQRLKTWPLECPWNLNVREVRHSIILKGLVWKLVLRASFLDNLRAWEVHFEECPCCRLGIPQKRCFLRPLVSVLCEHLCSQLRCAVGSRIYKLTFRKRLKQRGVGAKRKCSFSYNKVEKASCCSGIQAWKKNIVRVCRSKRKFQFAAGVRFSAGI